MKHILENKDVIELEKENVISGLPFDESKKEFLRKNIDSEIIFSFFLNIESPDQLKEISLKNTSFQTMSDYVPFFSDIIKLNILTAILKSAMFLHFISNEMTFDEQINFLIDLKNLNDIQILQNLIADTLEKNIRSAL